MAEPMKVRAKLAGDVLDVKILISHTMETGQRKDAKSGQVVPAHFIQNVTVDLNGKTAVAAQWGAAISKDPFLGLKLKGAKAGDTVTVNWEDNKGGKGSGATTIT